MPSTRPVPAHNLKTTRTGKVKKRSLLWRWRRLVWLAALSFTVFVAGVAFIVSRVELPVDPTVAPTQRETTFICSAEVQASCNASNAMAQFHGTEDRSVVAYEKIPEVLREAVLSAEDRDFFQHGGVDPVGIARAAWADIRRSGARQGGSTITQQYVKNTFLSRERTLNRKVKEAVMAVKLEQQLSKREILSRYLNTIYFGRGAYGVQAASRTWFAHDVEAVSLPEAAFLAGLIRSPQSADPLRGPASRREAERRRRSVLQAMVQERYIDSVQARDAGKVPLTWPFIALPQQSANLGVVKGEAIGSKYFVDDVRRFLLRRFGRTAVYGGGLKVYTTIDMAMQKAAYDAVTSTLDQPSDPAAALVAIDDRGHVKAMVGGRDYNRSQVNLAVGADGGGSGRQPGSTFKAFALAEAVKQGYSVASISEAPAKIDIPDGEAPGKDWPVGGGYPEGAVNGKATLVEATAHSVNTVYAQLVVRLGVDKVIATARQLGVSERAYLPPAPSIVLGTGSVSVLDMASAYSTFADQGQHIPPVVVTRVERPDGSVVDFTPHGTQVLSADQAARVSYCLQQVVSSGSGTAASIGRPAAGKTGTTTDNHDAWFVGYTPKLTAAVWMGYPGGNGEPVRAMDDVHGVPAKGGTFPAEMWRKFMVAATAQTDVATFPDPGRLDVGLPLDPKLGVRQPATAGPLTVGRSRYFPGTTSPSTPTTPPFPASTGPRRPTSTSTPRYSTSTPRYSTSTPRYSTSTSPRSTGP